MLCLAEWLHRRDDIDFGSSPWAGEVVLTALPFGTENGFPVDLAVLSRRWQNYNRLRIVSVSLDQSGRQASCVFDETYIHMQVFYNDTSQVALLYGIDKCAVFRRAEYEADVRADAERTAKRGKSVASVRRRPKEYTATFPLDDLLYFSYQLSHDDVTTNLGDKSKCEECGIVTEATNLRLCDGTHPSNVGLVYPEGACGRHFGCFRGFLCGSCETKLESKYWLCRLCTSPVTSYEQVWGYGIVDPQCLIPLDSLSFTSNPIGSPISVQPADQIAAHDLERAHRKDAAMAIYTRGAGDAVLEAASITVSMFRNSYVPLTIQQTVLTTVNMLHDKGLLVVGGVGVGGGGDLTLPKTVETLYHRARNAGAVVLDHDIHVKTVNISMVELRQADQVVTLQKYDVLTVIQNLLLDPHLPAGCVYLRPRGDSCPIYMDENETLVQGNETYQGTRWGELEQSLPHGGVMLGIGIHSDGVVCENHSVRPYMVTVENIPCAFRNGDRGCAKFGMCPSPSIRKPRSSNIAERLDPVQSIVKHSIEARSASEMLADLEAAAGSEVYE